MWTNHKSRRLCSGKNPLLRCRYNGSGGSMIGRRRGRQPLDTPIFGTYLNKLHEIEAAWNIRGRGDWIRHWIGQNKMGFLFLFSELPNVWQNQFKNFRRFQEWIFNFILDARDVKASWQPTLQEDLAAKVRREQAVHLISPFSSWPWHFWPHTGHVAKRNRTSQKPHLWRCLI